MHNSSETFLHQVSREELIDIYNPDKQEYRTVEAKFLCPNDMHPDMILVKEIEGGFVIRGIEIDPEIKTALTEDPETYKPRNPLEYYGRNVVLGLRLDKEYCERIVFKSEGQNQKDLIIETRHNQSIETD